MFRKLIYRLRCKFSFAYRLRNGWGLPVIRNDREMKALIDFCRRESMEYRKAGFDKSSHVPIWEETVRLYDKYQAVGWDYNELEDYIGQHVDFYWS